MKKAMIGMLVLSMLSALTACGIGNDTQEVSNPPVEMQETILTENEEADAIVQTGEQSETGENAQTGKNAETGEANGDLNSAKEAETQNLIVFFSLGGNAEDAENANDADDAENTDDVDVNASASLVRDGTERIGTTEFIARLIRQNIGGDLHAIQTAVPYPADFQAVIDKNHDEMNRGFLPELKESSLDISKYDTVFIGYPVWATHVPQAVLSFLEAYDFSGKTVIPFCTHDGYGAGSSCKNIADAIPEAEVNLDGLAVEAQDVPGAAGTVVSWLTKLGYLPLGKQAVSGKTPITITIGDIVLDGVIEDTALAQEIKDRFPLTISMSGFGGREYYGGVDFYPEDANLTGGGKTFSNGDITYCEAHHNMAIFYAQTENPILSVDVIPIGSVTSDLSVFETLPGKVTVTFALAE